MGAAAFALAVVLVGWQTDGVIDEARAATPASQSQATFPVTLRHRFGNTTIRKAPRRVIALTDDDFVVGLGVTPVAIPKNPFSKTGITPWLASALGKRRPRLLDVQSGYPFEAIAALKPDLIIGAVTESNYEILSKIAPTLEYVRGPNDDTWQERTLFIGRALGRSNLARALVRRESDRVSRARKRYSNRFRGKSFTLSLNYAPGLVSTLRSPKEAGVRFLGALGLRLSERVRKLPDSGGGRSDVSVERIDVLDANVLIVAHVTPGLRRDLEGNPLFASVPAVRDRRVVALPVPHLLALSRPSILNVEYLLSRVAPAISTALSRR